jgi:hypothetical protein
MTISEGGAYWSDHSDFIGWCVVVPLHIVDLPISLVSDTLWLPFDAHRSASEKGSQTEAKPPTAIAPPMFTRALQLDPVVLSQMQLQEPLTKGETSQDYLVRYFKTKQIEFKSPAFLKYEEATGRLMVHTTEAELDKVEGLITQPEEKK